MKRLQRAELNTFGLRVWGGSIEVPYPPHRHNEIELNAIEQGALTYILAGRQTTIEAGSVGLFWGAIPHHVIEYAPTTRLHWGTVPLDVVLGWDLPRPFVQALLAGMLFRDASPCYDQRFFARWQADLEAGQMTVVLMEMKAMFFRFALHPDAVPAAPVADHPDRDHRRASQMAAFMSQHFHEPLTVAEIARTVSLQPNYAMSIFRASFGLSLIAYLTQQRIAYAQQRLIMSDASAADIALEAGYQTLSHFYNAFTRVCGMPPGKYRAALLR